jgi:hypothetical protein
MKASTIVRFILNAALLACAATEGFGGETLLEKRFEATAESEALLELTASAPNSSWLKQGSEAAAVTITVDGRYSQDLILFHGSSTSVYRLMLGRVTPGAHTLRIEKNTQQSAASAGQPALTAAMVSLLTPQSPEFAAIAHAPILYARPNTLGRFSDIPLLTYYETEQKEGRTIYRYTVIFSNEDGGTQTSALMARWGRTTDIEWVIETELDGQGKSVRSIIQGVNHETKDFKGKFEANHPLLYTASDNNNFSDQGESPVRFALAPIPVDLKALSREEVMDRQPWIYQLMAEEMIREGKIIEERRVGRQIADLRRYLYIDAASTQHGGTGLSFAVKLKGDPHWYSSDQGILYNKIDRSGYFRTTILLPAGTKPDRIERFAVRCDALKNPRSEAEMAAVSTSGCDLKSVNKAFFLDQRFHPASPILFRPADVKLMYGEMIEIEQASK